MTKKCHNQILQTNQWHREEETQNRKSHDIVKLKRNIIILFLGKMIVKLERTPRTIPHNKHSTPNDDHAQVQINTIFDGKIVNIFLPSVLSYVLGALKNRLIETVLLSTHNMCSG